ncbi:MAG: glucokinase [Alphaproteobacteria bacterium]|nr:glucokinase [Alphaproteobacteria bacterium]
MAQQLRGAVLADIGGTNARFMLTTDNGDSAVEHARVSDFGSVRDALGDFLKRHDSGQRVNAAVLGVAGPVLNNRCEMTNSPWVIDGAELSQAFGFNAVHLLNDFEVLAWSLPQLQDAELFPIGTAGQTAGVGPMLVLGPGTGFGVSCLIEGNGGPVAITTEAGHASLPAETGREAAVVARLRQRFGHASSFPHVSIEQGALSGPGLQHLYQALADIDGIHIPQRDAAAITRAALDGSCEVSRLALEMFCALLGSVAGNLAVTFCARGGVFIGGGIVPRFPDFLAASAFRQRFESKGRFQSYLRDIPTRLIMKSNATFIGLKARFATLTAARKGGT